MKILIKYVRNKNKRVGLVFATKERVGWSLCDKYDKFNREEALKIAINRDESDTNVPRSIKKEFEKMEGRQKAYFK